MTYDELVHCVRAVVNSTGEDTVYIFGSQGIVAYYGDNLPYEATKSREIDIMTENNREYNSNLIAANFGEFTMFQEAFDLAIDGILVENISIPSDWITRSFSISCQIDNERIVNVITPNINDIAVCKLLAGRRKDQEWLSALYNENYLDVQLISNLLYKLVADFSKAEEAQSRLEQIVNGIEVEWVN